MVGNLTILRQMQRLTGIEGYERMFAIGENGSYWDLSWPISRYYNGSKISYVVCWSDFLVTDPEVPGSIPVPTRFSEK
jgi:hypothetical protein